MKLIIYLLILFFQNIFSSSLVVFPFEVNQINFANKKYNSTELINLLYKIELYTPLQLGSDNQKYFSIISFEDHHPMLLESHCEKMKLFQKNKNIIKKGYLISNSKTSKYLGNYTKYLNQIDLVEFYSEKYSFFNTTLIEEYKDNNTEITEIFLVKEKNDTITEEKEMCLSIGLSQFYQVYSSFVPPHFIDNLHTQRKIKTVDWTIKFTDQNNGLLIIGDLPHMYENDTIKYYEKNFTKSNTKNIVTFFRPWGIEMKEIYFYNSTNDKVLVNKDNNKFTIAHDFGFIIGSNNYKQLIYDNYFGNLINKKICVLEISDRTIYNRTNYFIDTDGSYSMFICDKNDMKNYIQNFPILYLSHIDYNYIFELTYKDLFMDINNYYYFMILFPHNQTGTSVFEDWHIGLPFLKQYQFILNFDYKYIGFYRTKNFEEKDENDENEEKKNDNENNENNKNNNEEKNNKVFIYILKILFVIILIILAIFFGRALKNQRKKRANELKDDDYEYMEENKNKIEKNDFIN